MNPILYNPQSTIHPQYNPCNQSIHTVLQIHIPIAATSSSQLARFMAHGSWFMVRYKDRRVKVQGSHGWLAGSLLLPFPCLAFACTAVAFRGLVGIHPDWTTAVHMPYAMGLGLGLRLGEPEPEPEPERSQSQRGGVCRLSVCVLCLCVRSNVDCICMYVYTQ